jgi:hypothetical protein
VKLPNFNGDEGQLPMPAAIIRDAAFRPCPVEPEDELFANGIFVFNVTRLLAFMGAHAERFPVEVVRVAGIPDYGGSGLNEKTVDSADRSQPVLLAEIAPGFYNLIDGHHRVAKARREGAVTVPGRRVGCPDQIPFLTSKVAYEKYVEYWNSKLQAMQLSTGQRVGRRSAKHRGI